MVLVYNVYKVSGSLLGIKYSVCGGSCTWCLDLI